MPQDRTDYKSTLVQVMDWWRQATSHYLNQCWPRSPMPYGVTRPQWVKNASFMIAHPNAQCRTLILTDLLNSFNSLRTRRNRRHFADIFKCIFLNENAWISHKFSLKFVPKVLTNNIPALVQIMSWCRRDDKPLSEPMMFSLLSIYTDAYRDCKSRRHISWHCTSSLWCCWHGTNLDRD